VATPIFEAGKVYCLGRVGHLQCLDAKSGEVLWSKNLQQEYQVAFSPGMPSPLVEGDLLILLAGGKPGACVIALDKHTGREIWKALDESLSFSSPIVVSSAGVRQLIVWTQESVASLNPRTGTVYWRHPVQTNSDYIVSTPVFDCGRLLVGGMMLQLAADKPAATLLWPASKATARRVFSNTSTALLQGEYVYSARSSGELTCVEAATGKPVWESDKATLQKNGASIHITPNGDTALLYTDQGELIRAKLTSQGYDEISRASVLQPTFPFAGRNVAWSPPAYANGRLYARSGKQLVCVRLIP
jgi:outer membrane protein assembly factor BamB